MSYVRVEIDERVVFEGEFGEWLERPPDFLEPYLTPNAAPEPWMQAVMVSMLNAVLTGVGYNITVHTWITGWSVSVERRK